MNQNNDPYDPDREPSPFEIWRMIFAWVSNPVHANAITAIATCVICITGIFYTVFAGKQWEANLTAANAANSAAKTAAEQLEMAERPWLSIVNPHVLSPLAWGENGMRVTVSFEVRNTGPTPAPMLFPNAELFVVPPKPPGILEHLNQISGPVQIVPGTLPEMVVPPNDQITVTEEIGVDDRGNLPISFISPIISVRYRSSFSTQKFYPYCTTISYVFWPALVKAKEKPGYFIPMNQLNFQINPMTGEIFR